MKLNWIEIFVCGLATYRLALLFSGEVGPFGMFTKIRSALKREAQHNKPLRQSKLHLGVSCILCESVWFGMVIATYANFHDRLPVWASAIGDIFLLAMALSALGILLNRAWPKR